MQQLDHVADVMAGRGIPPSCSEGRQPHTMMVGNCDVGMMGRGLAGGLHGGGGSRISVKVGGQEWIRVFSSKAFVWKKRKSKSWLVHIIKQLILLVPCFYAFELNIQITCSRLPT